LPKLLLEDLFDIQLSVNNHLDLAELKSSQKALYSQLDPSLWLPEDQPPSFIKQNENKYQLIQQCLYLEKNVFSRIVYTLQGAQANLVYLQFLPDNEIGLCLDEINFNNSLRKIFSICLNLLQQHAESLGLESIETDVYNHSLITIFDTAGYQVVTNPQKTNSPVTPHTSLKLIINNG
jgi:hypothetical protein